MGRRARALLIGACWALVPPAHAAAPQSAPAGTDLWTYPVVRGDTLIGISRELLLDPAHWSEIRRLNHVADPRHLQPGTVLRFPASWVRRSGTPATLAFVHGEVTVERAGAAPQPASAGGSVEPGDVLATGAEAAATLRFVDGSRMLVPGGTRLQVGALEAIGRARRPHTSVDLLQGEADVQVVKAGNGSAVFKIATPAINLGVRGTEFRVRYAPAQSVSRAEVTEGLVQAEAGGANVALAAGFGLAVPSTGALGPPVRLLPAPDLAKVPERLDRVPLRLDWPAVTGAAGYRAQVLAAASDDLLLDAAPAQPAAKWVDLPDGAYRLRVRAVDGAGLEGADADRPFVLKARPEPPLLVEPRADTKSYGDTARFRWAVATDPPRRYRLQVSSKPEFDAPEIDRPGLAGPSESVTLAPGQWWWRLAAVAEPDDAGPYGDAQSFEQRVVPAPPELGAARDDRGLVFAWGAPGPGQRVHYQAATDASFAQPLVDQTTEGREGVLPHPSPGTYFLRARTLDADGFEGPWGPVQRVQVSASPWWLLIPVGIFLWVL